MPLDAGRTLDRENTDGDAEAWIAGIPTGDPEAYEVMVAQFAAPLRHLAFRYTRSREAAAEVVQDVFFKLWRNRATAMAFPSRAQLRNYLYRAARNQALDYVARETTRSRAQAGPHEVAAEALHALPADAHVELADLIDVVDQVLADMPERRRAVCALRWRQGLSVAEIAERLGVALKTAEVQITRGLRQLRERLGRER